MRTAEQFAIEHAEYMAQSAENLLVAAMDLAAAFNMEDALAIEGAEENYVEAARHLQSMIYEFRKRAAKVPNVK